MTLTAVIWSVVLADLAALHLLWALRVWLPTGHERSLARAVLGTRGVEHMPGPVACLVVATALAVAASLPWWDAFGLQRAALLAAGAVFACRGVAAYVPAWERLTPEHPFRKLDRAVYGPLCLALGLLAISIGAAK